MKRNIQQLLLSFIFFAAVHADAEECIMQRSLSQEDSSSTNEKDCYGKLFAGFNFLQDTTLNGNYSQYDTGYVVGGSLGYYWCDGLHVEGEYAFRRNTIKHIHFSGQGSSTQGHFQTSSYMLNLLWDLPLSNLSCTFCDIQLFVGAGIGYDKQQMHALNSRINFHQSWNHFSWQLMTGFTYPIFCKADMAVEYKFHQGGCHFYNHSVIVAVIYKFNLN